MKNLTLGLCVALLTCVTAISQKTDDYKKAEVFIGYSNGQIEDDIETAGFLTDHTSFSGFNASAVVNLNRYLGLKADVSGTYKNQNLNFNAPGGSISFDADRSLYNFLGGVQIKNNTSDKVFKPFAHILVGAGRVRAKITNVSCPVGIDCSFIAGSGSDTGLTGAFGGGIDFRLNNKVQIRAIQVDYNPVRIDGLTLNNFRIGAGIVF
jgi:hypothetical protein